MTQVSNTHHFAPLDGLRGVAILMVMGFHFSCVKPMLGLPAKALFFAFSFGWCGVDLFFVLSGFLITGILIDSRESPGYFLKFYARRILRIFPLYYGILFVTLVLLPRVIDYNSPGLQQTLRMQWWLWMMSYNISVAVEHGQWLIGSDWLGLAMLWSLAVEEHFYLVWPFVVFALSRRALLRVGIGIVVVVPLLRAAFLYFGVPSGTVYSFTLCRIDALAVGGILASVSREPQLLNRSRQLIRVLGILGVTVIFGIFVQAKWFYYLAKPVQICGYTGLALAFGALLIEAVDAGPSSTMRKVLTHPILLFCGKYSYGAYLFHELLRESLRKLFPFEWFLHVTRLEIAALGFHIVGASIGTFALAYISYEFYEKRFLLLKRYFDYRQTTQKPRQSLPIAS